jgi:hypothetical protein
LGQRFPNPALPKQRSQFFGVPNNHM